MKLVIDLDGVIRKLPNSKDDKSYILDQKMIEFLRYRKKLGDYIVIFTASGMSSNNNDIGKVYTKNYVAIYNMLKEHEVPFDELILGKPNADIYIDDKAVRYNSNLDLKLPTFIITAAGRGRRTREISNLPKPIIPVANKPMMYWALKSLPLDIANRIILLYRDERIVNVAYDVLRNLGYNDFFIQEKFEHVRVDRDTDGQAETVIYAKEYLKNEPIVIYNIDTYFESYYIKSKLLTFTNFYDGIIGGFKSKEPIYSYIKIHDDRVIQVAEKIVISDIATTGLYGFSDMKQYEYYYNNYSVEIKKHYNEVYIAPLYQYMINDSKRIWFDIAERAYSLGSKPEVELFEKLFQP